MKSIYVKTAITSLVMIFLASCATIPEAIQYESTATIGVQAVQQNTAEHKGKSIRWGGIITQVINNENDTWIELLALNLRDSGRPILKREDNQGRFIAKVSEFLDPAVYQVGQSFTVVGNLSEKIDGTIGKYKYSFPVVNVTGHYLWPKQTYRQVPYIMPGFWHYGAHPMWRFGYGYYGYGVRYHSGYYPYYPLYGHLQQRITPISAQRPRTVYPIDDRLWEHRVKQLASRRAVLSQRQKVKPNYQGPLRQATRSGTITRNAIPRLKTRTTNRRLPVKFSKPIREINND